MAGVLTVAEWKKKARAEEKTKVDGHSTRGGSSASKRSRLLKGIPLRNESN